MSDQWNPDYPAYYTGPGAPQPIETGWTRREADAAKLAEMTGITLHEARLQLAMIEDRKRLLPAEPLGGAR